MKVPEDLQKVLDTAVLLWAEQSPAGVVGKVITEWFAAHELVDLRGVAALPLGGDGETLVDAAMLPFVSGRCWQRKKGKLSDYAMCSVSLEQGRGGRMTTVYLHQRVADIAGLIVPDGFMLDHINGDGLDNRLCNIRVVDRNGNGANRAKRSGAHASDYKGVSRDRRAIARPWRAYVTVDGAQKALGTFATEEEAARAYDEAAIAAWGPLARTNFINPPPPPLEPIRRLVDLSLCGPQYQVFNRECVEYRPICDASGEDAPYGLPCPVLAARKDAR